MDILKRNHAPLTDEAWNEIDSVAREALTASLSARRFVDVDGPHGIDFAAVSLGRLSVPDGQNRDGVCYGICRVLPLIEGRISFTLEQWELDNLNRGARDVELQPLVDAARQAAAFEDNAVFNGLDSGGIAGITQATEHDAVSLPLEDHGVIDAIGDAQVKLLQEGIDGPCALVVGPKVWKVLARNTQGGTLRSLVQGQIDGSVVFSNQLDGALLVSTRGGDLELTLGQDFAIGYLNHDSNSVTLYLTESFTFRVISPEAIVPLTVKQ